MVKRDLKIEACQERSPIERRSDQDKRKTAKKFQPVRTGEPEKSAGISQSAETAGCGSVNGAVSRFSTNKPCGETQYFIIISESFFILYSLAKSFYDFAIFMTGGEI